MPSSADEARNRRLVRGIGLVLAAAIAAAVGCGSDQTAPKPAPAAESPNVAVALRAAEALYDGIQTVTLPNGLVVHLKPIPDWPTVSTFMVYRVGAADEDLDHTGLAHYLEHLQFKGTDRLMPGDIDRITLKNGGENNAYTSEDATIYYFDFAADRWEAALEIEADRMRNLRIDEAHEFQNEKGAVIEELEQGEDEPWDLEYKTALPLLFGSDSPYGHPTIGTAEHVREATAETIKAFYDAWYHPNNASLVVVGGFEPERALSRIRELFLPIPAGSLPPRKPFPSSDRRGPVEKTLTSRFGIPNLLVAYPACQRAHPDYPVLTVIESLLAGGRKSRLYERLVETEELASNVNLDVHGGRHPGWIEIQIELFDAAEKDAAMQTLLAEMGRLRDERVEPGELERARQILLSDEIFNNEDVHFLGETLADAAAQGDLASATKFLPRLARVTADDVQQAARRYLADESRVVVLSVPEEPEEPREQKTVRSAPARASARPLPVARNSRRILRGDASATSASGGLVSLTGVERLVLDNGLVVLLHHNPRLPIFVAEAYVRNVSLLEPAEQAGLATLTGYQLDEGTRRHTGGQIAERIENVGGLMIFDPSGGVVAVLSPAWETGLDQLCECLSQSTFPEDGFYQMQDRLLSEIVDEETQPQARAVNLFHKLVYSDHPYASPPLGTQETVAGLSREDCQAFYAQAFRPNNMILAVSGDFDRSAVVEKLRAVTSEWEPAEIEVPDLPRVDVDFVAPFEEGIVTLSEASQLQICLGHVGIVRANPDFERLLVLDYVLGMSPGFTDRLSSRLRDREGLAYTVQASITQSASEEPGTFVCILGTDERQFARVKELLRAELRRIREEPISDGEVDDVKSYLLGNLPFRFTTNLAFTAEMIEIERFSLGWDYFDQYRQRIASVTSEQVQEMAIKYIHPDRMILVAAGPLDEKGRPIEAAGP